MGMAAPGRQSDYAMPAINWRCRKVYVYNFGKRQEFK